MLFRSIATVFSGILFAQGTLAALTPADVVTNVGIVTAVSGNLNSLLSAFSNTPTPQQAQTMSQTVVQSFTTIIQNLAADVTAMQSTPPMSDVDAGPIVDSLRAFVAVHQALLSTVIGKHGVFAQFGVTAPIAAVLRTLEAGIDSFAFAMIDMIPTRQSDVTTDKNSLDSSVQNTISIYQQICIPNILYPALPPICVGL